ncbi:hypothetical protein [Geodermatophilus sabuli]|uniref:Uncharacterized protein n=1 Tax=Geodermatophilus sabuli TaxID=1564158 RepID=A0A285EDD7_9ACTN|nr:hypothetical protein [Geodermatophilus sabuli]MBB3084679.1 hypothetical protein [Geodermatophilus sabuli]SNX97129.1 hypothetical protein SAMN06893097_10679 [Geodermatophilus sabuli]
MATTLQQLLDDLAEQAGAPAPAAAIEDVTGALSHLGRALTGLTDDGLTPTASARQSTSTELADACATAGRLWPTTGGPLTDLAGAAADLIGRDRVSMGRAHRWAVTVELAEVADRCARLGRRLLPESAAPELAFVRMIAAAVERDAQIDPPNAEGAAVLDRLVPMPRPPSGETAVTALDASAALVAALDRAGQAGNLALRDFRAGVAAAEITCRYAAFTTGRAGGDAGPLLVTGLAWQLAGRASTVFHDGQREEAGDRRGVVAWAQALVGALRHEVEADAGTTARRDGSEPVDVAAAAQRVTGQLPALGGKLIVAVGRWSRTGRLYANARDLPPMENMPLDRVSAVIAGRQVRASGTDLDRLRLAVGRAADLSTGLTHVLACAASPATASQRPLPSAPERLLDRAHAAALSLAAVRSGPDAARGVLPAPPDL